MRNPQAVEVLQRSSRRSWHTVRDRRQRRLSRNLDMLLIGRTGIDHCGWRTGAVDVAVGLRSRATGNARERAGADTEC